MKQDVDPWINEFSRRCQDVEDDNLIAIDECMKGILLFQSANLSEAQNMTVSMNHTLDKKEDFKLSVIQQILKKLRTSEKPIGKRENYFNESFTFDSKYAAYYQNSDRAQGFYYGADGSQIDVFWNYDKRKYVPTRSDKRGCFVCGKQGHMAKDCRKNRSASRRSSRSRGDRSRSFSRRDRGSRASSRGSQRTGRRDSRGSYRQPKRSRSMDIKSKRHRSVTHTPDRRRGSSREKKDRKNRRGRESEKDKRRDSRGKRDSRRRSRDKNYLNESEGSELKNFFTEFDMGKPVTSDVFFKAQGSFLNSDAAAYWKSGGITGAVFMSETDTEYSGFEHSSNMDTGLTHASWVQTLREPAKTCHSSISPDWWQELAEGEGRCDQTERRYRRGSLFREEHVKQFAEIHWSSLMCKAKIMDHKKDRHKLSLWIDREGTHTEVCEIYGSEAGAQGDESGHRFPHLLLRFKSGCWSSHGSRIRRVALSAAIMFKIEMWYATYLNPQLLSSYRTKEYNLLIELWRVLGDSRKELANSGWLRFPQTSKNSSQQNQEISGLMSQVQVAKMPDPNEKNYQVMRNQAYVFCIGCQVWIPYDDFKPVCAEVKDIPGELVGIAYHSGSQMKCSHKYNKLLPTYRPC